MASDVLPSESEHPLAKRDDIVTEGIRGSRIFELRQGLSGDGAPIASNNYFCGTCGSDPSAAAAFDAATPPEGFTISPRRTLLAAHSLLFDPVNSRNAPRDLDLVEGIEGIDSRLGAQPQFGEFVDGLVVLVTMESTRRLEWDAGDTIHELNADDGHTYVLFALTEGATPPEEMELPSGYAYAAREITEPLVLEPVSRVRVLFHLTTQHLWQRVVPPE